MQSRMVPWSCSARFRLPVEDWKRMMAAYYPGGGWVRLQHRRPLTRLQERKAAARAAVVRRRVLAELLG